MDQVCRIAGAIDAVGIFLGRLPLRNRTEKSAASQILQTGCGLSTLPQKG
jgi:hypothetical protein